MIYLILGDDTYSINKKIESILSDYKDCESSFFRISTKEEYSQLLKNISTFFESYSFFNQYKSARILMYDDFKLTKDLSLTLSKICDYDCIAFIIINSSNLNNYKQIKSKNIQTLIFSNPTKFNDAFLFAKTYLQNFNIKFKTNYDLEKILKDIVYNSKNTGTKSIFDKNTITIEIDKLNLFYLSINRPLCHLDTKDFYITKFDGNYFNLVDYIFNSDNIHSLINYYEPIFANFTTKEYEDFIRVLIYTIKEYIKYINNYPTKKSYLFKKTNLLITDPVNFLIDITDLNIQLRFNNKLTLDSLIYIFIKYSTYIDKK